LVARSEQGLLFWVFAEVLQDKDRSPPEAWKQELRQAAEMVGFRRLDELWDLVNAEGENPNYLRDDPYDSAYAFFEGYEVELLTRTRRAQ
jgi:hypothetical protein